MTQSHKHTPAPWYYKNERIYSESQKDGLPIAQINEIYKDDDEARANAHLIAAAPLLLKRLEQALEYLEHPDVVTMEFAKCSIVMAEQARAAINKATKGAM